MTSVARPTTAAAARTQHFGPQARPLPQYSVPRILAVWAAATIPMAALAWVAAPWLAGLFDGPAAGAQALILCLTAGLVWQAVLVAVLVHREQGSLRWPVLKDALWLHAPTSPRSGRRGGRLWWVLLPLALLAYAKEALPSLPAPEGRDFGPFLQTAAGQDFLSGNWTWLVIILAMAVFNTVLGEELLFRGLLLPRMQGAFGRWDWAANAVLFAVYHLHAPWAMPARLASGVILAYPSRRYRSAVLGILVHSIQSVVLTVLVVMVVLR